MRHPRLEELLLIVGHSGSFGPPRIFHIFPAVVHSTQTHADTAPAIGFRKSRFRSMVMAVLFLFHHFHFNLHLRVGDHILHAKVVKLLQLFPFVTVFRKGIIAIVTIVSIRVTNGIRFLVVGMRLHANNRRVVAVSIVGFWHRLRSICVVRRRCRHSIISFFVVVFFVVNAFSILAVFFLHRSNIILDGDIVRGIRRAVIRKRSSSPAKDRSANGGRRRALGSIAVR
mmetsp:Transcript_62064/g.93686  ORF Transcript_62064/g.93686 Transcript_62064/m.93686 type:complete len:227 (+) Transcript_62064:2154-2834(+)